MSGNIIEDNNDIGLYCIETWCDSFTPELVQDDPAISIDNINSDILPQDIPVRENINSIKHHRANIKCTWSS